MKPASLAKTCENEEARRLVDQLRATETEVRQNHEELMRVLGNTELEAAVNLYTQKALPRLTEAGQTTERLTQQQSALMAAVSKSAEAPVARSRWTTTWSLPLTAVTMLCRLPDYAVCSNFWLTPPGF